MPKAKQLKSGNWNVRVYEYTDENGKKHYKSITASSKKDAEYKASLFALNHENENSYDNLTLREGYERYISSKSSILSPSTVVGYTRSMENHFQLLMPMKLSKITANLIQIAVNEMSANHSPKTVRNAHGLLHSVLSTYYPSLEMKTTLPQKVKPQYTIPTAEDINKLLDEANDKIRVPILLASQGGLRRSEICALTLNDVTDFGVKINKASVIDKNKEIVIKTTKTVAGTRFVPLSHDVIGEIRRWQYFGITPAALSGQFIRLIEKADVPKFSFHKLRHYFASELHANGIPDQYIAQIGGWENVAVLQNIYQHTLRDKEEQVAQNVTNIFSSRFNKEGAITKGTNGDMTRNMTRKRKSAE